MKIRIPFSLLLIIALAGVFSALTTFAADGAPPTDSAADSFAWWTYVIPALTPILILLVKVIVPKIPNLWLPTLAPVLGVALQAINDAVSSAQFSLGWGIVLGLAGVGVREWIDQLKQTSKGTAGTPAESKAYEVAVEDGKTMKR